MAFEDLREDRLTKLELLKKAGVDPYPAVSNRDTSVHDALSYFENLTSHTAIYTLAGRVMSTRFHGGVAFADIFDGSTSATIQIVLKKDEIGENNFNLFESTIDRGDFAEFAGLLFITNRGQNSLAAKNWRMLTKSIRPLPDSWSGLVDQEEKLRKRYLDILMNPEVREMVLKRARFWNSMRSFLVSKDFIEVETPIFETTPGGADAEPFTTHHNAMNMDVYLRISQGELWQKRLMVAGLPKTFEIGRQFRNEGMSAEHAQEYTQMEFYWGYADYKKGMELVKEMVRYIAMETFGTLKFRMRDFDVDLGDEWQTYDYAALIKEKTGIDIDNAGLTEIESKLQELGVRYDKKGFNVTRAIDNLWKYCRKSIGGPGFLINVPVTMEPLAKRDEKDPSKVQRFQFIIAGSEMGKGYSELNDPIDQAERFGAQQEMRDTGDKEAQFADMDFVEALEYGMPPTCGFGISERFFSFMLGKSIHEGQIFPLMKPRN
ncbi:MAG: lysine--tRNA ligase [Candidatus Vogelbacteria bacterium]|nr:lysine--tRNA ligase [Candidatus Vogelbacteria bacterium]